MRRDFENQLIFGSASTIPPNIYTLYIHLSINGFKDFLHFGLKQAPMVWYKAHSQTVSLRKKCTLYIKKNHVNNKHA